MITYGALDTITHRLFLQKDYYEKKTNHYLNILHLIILLQQNDVYLNPQKKVCFKNNCLKHRYQSLFICQKEHCEKFIANINRFDLMVMNGLFYLQIECELGTLKLYLNSTMNRNDHNSL